MHCGSVTYDDIIKFPHPVHQSYEVHLLPHLRVYNKADGTYISQKNNSIKIPMKKFTKYDLLKFCLECKDNTVIDKSKEVNLINNNNPIAFENLQIVDKVKSKNKSVILHLQKTSSKIKMDM